MTSMLNPTCPLCGLRYASKPLLELHIREDHRPRRRANRAASTLTAPGRPRRRLATPPTDPAWHPGRPAP